MPDKIASALLDWKTKTRYSCECKLFSIEPHERIAFAFNIYAVMKWLSAYTGGEIRSDKSDTLIMIGAGSDAFISDDTIASLKNFLSIFENRFYSMIEKDNTLAHDGIDLTAPCR